MTTMKDQSLLAEQAKAWKNVYQMQDYTEFKHNVVCEILLCLTETRDPFSIKYQFNSKKLTQRWKPTQTHLISYDSMQLFCHIS